MAIKKPSIKKPGIVKPNVGKKAAPAKPTIVEKSKVEMVQEEPIVEEIVNEIEVPVIEEEVEIPTDIIVEEVKTIEEAEKIEEVLIESSEPESEEELQKRLEEAAHQEVVEVVEKTEVEEKPKKKSSRKKSTAKKEEDEKQESINKADYKAKSLTDAMKEMIGVTGCTTPEWEETKATITEQVQGMHIDPDSTPAEMRYLIADIDAALSDLKIRKINADQRFNPLLKHINYVSLQAGSKGSNSEERKANAIKGLIEYKSNPEDMEYTNLLDIQVFAENQIAFYDEMIKILQDKKNMLITFSGIVKTETQLGSY